MKRRLKPAATKTIDIITTNRKWQESKPDFCQNEREVVIFLILKACLKVVSYFADNFADAKLSKQQMDLLCLRPQINN